MSSDARDVILAIDQGTTGSTCLLLSPDLRVLGRANREFPQHFPRAGWVEHDPDELWASVLAAIQDVLAVAKVPASRIAAIGVTNQRETSLIWERASGRAIHRALVWQDRRTSGACAQLEAEGNLAMVRERSGLVLDPYFSATKLAWTLDHVEGARAAASRGELAAGTVDTYLLWRLTGGRVHATEPSNASRTSLWNLKSGAGEPWDEDLCTLFRVPSTIMPLVRPSAGPFGTTQGVPGLPDGIPICGVAGDQQSALFGQACFEVGESKCTYGTGAFIMLNTGSSIARSEHGLLTTVAWQLGDQLTYALEGSAFMAGAVVQWLRDGLGLISTSAEVESLAREVPDSGGVVLVPAHAGLGAPHWRPDARGLIRGLTRGSTKAHIARAALEGIALEVADLITAMRADLDRAGAGRITELRVDGGACANDLLMQMQADLLDLPVDRPAMLDTTALGATFLAGLGAGIWRDQQELRRTWVQERRFVPGPQRDWIEGVRRAWNDAISCA